MKMIILRQLNQIMKVSNFPKSGGKDGGCGEDSDFTNNRKQRTRQVGLLSNTNTNTNTTANQTGSKVFFDPLQCTAVKTTGILIFQTLEEKQIGYFFGFLGDFFWISSPI